MSKIVPFFILSFSQYLLSALRSHRHSNVTDSGCGSVFRWFTHNNNSFVVDPVENEQKSRGERKQTEDDQRNRLGIVHKFCVNYQWHVCRHSNLLSQSLLRSTDFVVLSSTLFFSRFCFVQLIAPLNSGRN